MRRALDISDAKVNEYITLGFGVPGWGYFGKHAGYDYGVKEWPVKATESGIVVNVRVAPLLDGGNIVELQSDKYDHRFLHLKSVNVARGQAVTEGQTIGISGNTGNVGYHLHHDVRKKGTKWTDSFSNYYDWEKLIKQGEIIVGDIKIVDSPSAVSWGNGRIDVFARGTDNGLWHKWYDGKWNNWERLGGGVNSSPDASSWSEGRLDVFNTGVAGDLMHWWFDENGWHPAESLGIIKKG